MATTQPPPSPSSAPVVRTAKPVSEALLNDKNTEVPQETQRADPPTQQWDHAISSLLIRSTIGLSFGVIFSVLLFKRRAWPAILGLGFGAGRAWEEADNTFKRGGTTAGREGLRFARTS